MKFDSVEDAYDALSNYLRAFVEARQWEKAVCTMSILGSMAKGSHWLSWEGNTDDQGGFENNHAAIWKGLDAALYLRDDLLRMTGDRIWGLTFTLYPTGKFKIEYDYNKPDGYEENDETINLSDAVERLQKLGVEVQVTENKK